MSFAKKIQLSYQDDIPSAEIVPLAFCTQTRRDDKEVACLASVADTAGYSLRLAVGFRSERRRSVVSLQAWRTVLKQPLPRQAMERSAYQRHHR